MWNNLELDQWVTDSFENLTNAYTYNINVRFGNLNQSRLVAGSLSIPYIQFGSFSIHSEILNKSRRSFV
jgi:hypothetical protein